MGEKYWTHHDIVIHMSSTPAALPKNILRDAVQLYLNGRNSRTWGAGGFLAFQGGECLGESTIYYGSEVFTNNIMEASALEAGIKWLGEK